MAKNLQNLKGSDHSVTSKASTESSDTGKGTDKTTRIDNVQQKPPPNKYKT